MRVTIEAIPTIGFRPEEVNTAEPTRAARLKWVIVVDGSLPPGRAANAAACLAAATAAEVDNILGPAAVDGGATTHAGLPWIGCTVLVADRELLRSIRARGVAHEGTFVADMPLVAQETRVYDDFVRAMRESSVDDIDYLAVSLVGPKNRIDKIVGRLPLMP